MSKIGRMWWVDGQKATEWGGEITPSARLLCKSSSEADSQFLLLLLYYPPSEKLFPSPHLEYFFQANQGIFPQRVLKADHHLFYRNLLCIRKCTACTQAYISKYNSFSFPSPASFAEPPICAVHLQTCKCDRSPPASHRPAPLGAAGSNYQPCLTHNTSVMMTQRVI